MFAYLGHDLFEDTSTSRKQVLDNFGEKALAIIEELTYNIHNHGLKSKYLATFKDKSIEAIIGKLADRYCNVMDFYYLEDNSYSRNYVMKAEEVYKAFANRRDEIPKVIATNICNDYNSLFIKLRIPVLEYFAI